MEAQIVMAVESRRTFARGMAVAVLVGFGILMAGCGTTPFSSVTGLPAGAQPVGGGLQISWAAPEGGTVYLVEKTSGKILATRTLNEGNKYEFEMGEEGPEMFQKVVGVPVATAQLVLYFKPAKK